MPAFAHPNDGLKPADLVDGKWYEVTLNQRVRLGGEYTAVEICKWDADWNCFFRSNNEPLVSRVTILTIMPLLGDSNGKS